MHVSVAARIGATTVAVLLCAATGCTRTTEPAAPTPTAPPTAGRTYQWVPNPAVDLMSPQGTFIRAALESFDLVMQSDSKGLDAYQDGYPGYGRAQRLPDAEFVGGIDPRRQTIVGTTFYEVIDLMHDGDTYTAKICEYKSRATGRDVVGNYYDNYSLLGTSQTMTFGPDPALTPAQQYAPLADQKGPARRPTDNVFGTWILTDIDPLTTYPECRKLAPGTPAHQAVPPPTLPPDPGWPNGAST